MRLIVLLTLLTASTFADAYEENGKWVSVGSGRGDVRPKDIDKIETGTILSFDRVYESIIAEHCELDSIRLFTPDSYGLQPTICVKAPTRTEHAQIED